MTTTHVLKTLAILPMAVLSLKLTAMMTMTVPLTHALKPPDATTLLLYVTITMPAPMTLVMIPLVVYTPLSNV